jgi:hypothetical protein
MDTRTQQSDSDIAPEGQQPNARTNDAAGVSFTDAPAQPDGQPVGDSLPLDGSLTLNDTEPIDQTGLQSDQHRLLTGAESEQTATGVIDAEDATDRAIDSKGAYGATSEAATTGDDDVTEALNYVQGDKPGQVATGGQ